MNPERSVSITGIGLLSCLGVGKDAHWNSVSAANGEPVIDTVSFAPYVVHPLPEIDWSTQIPRRDQRQMEPWQRIGTFTAGLALADAGFADDEPAKAAMDMTIAAAGGERDVDVDTLILTEAAGRAESAGTIVNEKLLTELRPTLFLAQLSNLLAGNISIVHKVTGSSRTFMGEEGAGLSALQSAVARIRSGQSDLALVGASYSAEHWDMILGNEVCHPVMRGGWLPVFERGDADDDRNGLALGSGGAFLVLEAHDRAKARGAHIYADITHVLADQGRDDQTTERLDAIANSDAMAGVSAIISMATGAPKRTREEMDWLDRSGKPFADLTSRTGYLREAQAIMGTAVAAMAIDKSSAPLGLNTDPSSLGVMVVGQSRAEGFIRLERSAS